ncbi:hypothetical protein LZQ00_03770 [Sphingobacterium sp. SRCM116780]|uniref:hypothetical protein n=1 Tax=Sphingobacterium sp. SRCM116780 TaxID=2907623 RepID=UPI001F18B556|nr:hypothetical protein [Sphingobacterium sp. SRCM116780]UIR56939.1 hypothetical protein LZQ00_03770 [Sphingobacterium sp. SRCM116780]
MKTLLLERFKIRQMKESQYQNREQPLKSILKVRPQGRYYAMFTPPLEELDSYSCVVRDEKTDIIRISLVNMAIYEFYLFAHSLSATFPTSRILVYNGNRCQYIYGQECGDVTLWKKQHLYCYEITLPADTEREEYQQRILNDLDATFQLEVKIEKEQVVSDIYFNEKMGYPEATSWHEQTVMTIRPREVIYP